MILEKIRQAYPHLTKSQRRLADFIVSSYQEAAFLSAARLARRLDLNEATVIRFAQRLGYAGYPELVQDVRALVLDELRTPGGVVGEPAPEPAFLTSLGWQVQALRRAVSHVTPEVADQVASALRGARRIFVVGEGLACHLASVLASGLAGQGLDAWAAPVGAEGLASVLARLGPGDLLIGICVEEAPEVARAAAFARQRGVHTMVVAPSAVCQAAQAGELVLTCAATDTSQGEAVGVLAGLLGALVHVAASLDPGRRRRFALAADAAIRALRGE
ncbi:MAG: MurR/RpiR family transcriptional regulator [Anaerolineae bacterium]|nr:MurR/RpiR family transcriptional regulator [Anaerolineae bacterium]